jgi:hypothetical protein
LIRIRHQWIWIHDALPIHIQLALLFALFFLQLSLNTSTSIGSGSSGYLQAARIILVLHIWTLGLRRCMTIFNCRVPCGLICNRHRSLLEQVCIAWTHLNSAWLLTLDGIAIISFDLITLVVVLQPFIESHFKCLRSPL